MAEWNVELTPAEWTVAAQIGLMRNNCSIAKGNKNNLGVQTWIEDFASHFYGCAGEIAFAKAMGVFHCGDEGRYGKPDVAGYGVRTVFKPTSKCLCLKDKDSDSIISVLAVWKGNSLTLSGWLRNADGKIDKYRYKSGLYLVPVSDLNHMDTLPSKELSTSKECANG